MSLTVNNMMGLFEDAEAVGLIEIVNSEKLEKWLHEEEGYPYLEELGE